MNEPTNLAGEFIEDNPDWEYRYILVGIDYIPCNNCDHKAQLNEQLFVVRRVKKTEITEYEERT